MAAFEVRRPPLRPGRSLETVFSWSGDDAPGALLCGPQPLLGGDLDNNVLRALAGALVAAGRCVLRFNYRSVGRSAPLDARRPDRSRYESWREIAEAAVPEPAIADAAEAWRLAVRHVEIDLIVGYSFGAEVALHLARRVAFCGSLVLVAPPLERLDRWPAGPAVTSTRAILAARDDFAGAPPPEGWPAAVARRLGGVPVHTVEDTDHFFAGDEPRLAAAVLEGLAETVR